MKRLPLLTLSALAIAFIPLGESQATIDTGTCKHTGLPGPFNWSASLPERLDRVEVNTGDVRQSMILGIRRSDRTKDHVALSRSIVRGPTPSLRQSQAWCRGSDKAEEPSYSDQDHGSVTYAECDGDCSSISKADLVDLAYQDPLEMTFIISGRWSFEMNWEGEGDRNSAHSFAIDDGDFEFKDLLVSRIGDDGVSFHPEIFRFRGQVRHLKNEYPNQRKRITLPLITQVDTVEICPFGNTAAKCAPGETSRSTSEIMKIAEAEEGSVSKAWALIPLSIVAVSLSVFLIRRRRQSSI